MLIKTDLRDDLRPACLQANAAHSGSSAALGLFRELGQHILALSYRTCQLEPQAAPFCLEAGKASKDAEREPTADKLPAGVTDSWSGCRERFNAFLACTAVQTAL